MNKYLKLLLPSLLIIVMGLTVSCIQVVSPSELDSEGIEVHGDWTITVTNPDGTVDSIQEFSNDIFYDLYASGADVLTALLAGQAQITAWEIIIGATSGIDCQEESKPGNTWYRLDATVTRDVSIGTPLRLTTTCTVLLSDATSTTQIKEVYTIPSLTPDGFPIFGINGDNTYNGFIHFTVKEILEPDRVDLQHNQVVSINVVISFQSGS